MIFKFFVDLLNKECLESAKALCEQYSTERQNWITQLEYGEIHLTRPRCGRSVMNRMQGSLMRQFSLHCPNQPYHTTCPQWPAGQ